MANRRYIDFPIASSVGGSDIILIWQSGANKQTTKATFLSGLPENLDELNDVAISGLTNGQILRYDSVTGKWENTDQGNLDLNDLNDVSIVSPSNGQVLVYNSSTSRWENSSGGYVPYTGAVTTVNLGAQTIQAGSFVKAGGTAAQFLKANGSVDSNVYGTGTVTSVALTMPSAFSVANSPVTTAGTLAVTGAGTVGQYIRGDGSLADFPATTGGGSSVSYYLNGSVSQGTIGGVAYKQLNRTPVFGAGTDFTINADGYIASFITDASDPNKLLIPAGNWNFETYFSASSSGGSPSFYVELYKYDGTTFTLIATSSSAPELIAFGTSLNPYYSTLAVPQTALALTDRLAIRYFVTHSGRTITLHTEDNHLCQIITTFTTGLTALNGLTAQVQNFAVGTSGTDFAIASATATHTFNLPTASATNRGALSSADWTTFNNKTSNLGTVTSVALTMPAAFSISGSPVTTAGTLAVTATGTTGQYIRGDGTLATFPTVGSGTVTSVGLSSATSGVTIGSTPVTTSGTITLAIATASGSQNGLLSSTDWTTFNSKQPAGNYVTLDTTQTITGQKTISRNAALFNGTVQSFLIDGAAGGGSLTLNSITGLYAYQTFAQGGVGKFEIGIVGTADNGSLYINKTVQVGETGASIYIKKLDGFVGINNITPTFQLDVNGTSRFTNVMSIDAGAFASEALVLNSSTNQQYIAINSATGFEAMTKYFNPTAGNWYSGIRVSAGLGSTSSYHIYSSTYFNDVFVLNTDGTAKFASSVTGGSFIKSGGTSSQFLKADGSIDSTTYQSVLTNPITGTGTTNYLPKFTGSTTIGNSNVFNNSTSVGINTSNPGNYGLAIDYSGPALAVLSIKNTSSTGYSAAHLINNSGTLMGHFGYANASTGATLQDVIFIGSIASKSLVFTTADTIKMSLFSNGNLNINDITDSGYKLNVNGTGRFTGQLTLTTGSSQPLVLNGSSDQYLFISSGGAEAMTQYYNPTAGNWYTGIRTAAGLGTTASYHIYSSTYGNDVFAINTNGNATFAQNLTVNSGIITGTLNTTSTTTLVTTIGFVGIGTNSPAAKLHIETGTVSYGQVRIKSSGAIGGETSIHYGRTSQTLEEGWTIGQGVAGIGDPFGFYTGGNVRLMITTGGNVMIATTTDSGDKLRVNGTSFSNTIMTWNPENDNRSGITWRLGGVSNASITPNRRLRVNVGGVEYYIGAVEV